MTKPTGTAEVPEYLQLIWQAEEAITSKAATRELGDPETDVVESSSDSVIEISDSSSDTSTLLELGLHSRASAHAHATSLKAAGSSSTVKKPSCADGPPPLKRSRGAMSSSLLDTIQAAFDPKTMEFRDQQRFAFQLQANQVSSLQAELREVRSQLDTEREKAHAEARRADRMEMELKMLQAYQTTPSIPHKRRSTAFDEDDCWLLSPRQDRLALFVTPRKPLNLSRAHNTPHSHHHEHIQQPNNAPGPSGLVPSSPVEQSKIEESARSSSPLSYWDPTPKKSDH